MVASLVLDTLVVSSPPPFFLFTMQGFGIGVSYVMSKIKKPIRWGPLDAAKLYSWPMLFSYNRTMLTYEMYFSQKLDKG